ncbi:MAG: N-acyl homoserine lactonase family protein [candidate division NC10 bacterium]|nr:N-acyl homoserine lactonase family protein [candidate division NC10 bacterium]
MKRRGFLRIGAAALGAAALGEKVPHLFRSQAARAEATGSAPPYEIYALNYAGPFPRKLAMVLWNEGWDQDIEVNYYLWAIKGRNGEIIVVDAGCGTTLASQRGLKNYVKPVEVLARIGANGENVSKVILTHLHFDHMGGMEMFPLAFPRATFYVQKKEYDFWVKHPFVKRPPFNRLVDEVAIQALAKLEGTERLVLVWGDQKILPGIELLSSPGHTIGLQSVSVNTAQGTAIVASDCLHVHRAFRENNTSILITDLIAWIESYDKLRAKASSIDLVFPGHDMALATDYPRIAEGVTRLV